MIEIHDLEFSYEVRMIDPQRSWLLNLLRSDYRSHPVLRGIDLRVEGAGITALLGRNGAGKTTMIKLLSGILTPNSGEIRVLGFEPRRRQNAYLSQIGVIFGQKKMLWPELSLEENLEITRALYRVAREGHRRRTGELIELFSLAELCQRPVKSYSLGESMKAEIVNVLSYRPRVLFLDEPTIGMDVGSQRTLREAIIRYVDAAECHIILTSHNMRDVAELATDILFLEEGRITRFDKAGGSLQTVEVALEERFLRASG